MSLSKPHLGLALFGHHKAGKSTLLGHFALKRGLVTHTWIDKMKKEAKQDENESHYFAYISDTTRVERRSGSSIICKIMSFNTVNYCYSIIDIPGKRFLQFIKNVIRGLTFGDVGILMVSAVKSEFKESIRKFNPENNQFEGTTIEFSKLSYILRFKQLIICINKMDKILYNESEYNSIKNKLINILTTTVHYKRKKLYFIPISAFNGDNLLNKSDNLKWFNGYSLFEALDKFIKLPKRKNKNKMFKMSVSNVWKVKGIGDVICGKVEEGKIGECERVAFYPTNCSGKTFSLVMHYKRIKQGIPGDWIGVHVITLAKHNMPKIGDLMYLKSNDNIIKKQIVLFKALIVVQNIKNTIKPRRKINTKNGKYIYKNGYTPYIHINKAKTNCEILSINYKIDKNNQNKILFPKDISHNEMGEVTFEPKKQIFMQRYKDSKPFGTIIGTDNKSLILYGKIIKITYKSDIFPIVIKYWIIKFVGKKIGWFNGLTQLVNKFYHK